MSVSYGLPNFICIFFAANPDEEMTTADICAKWGVPKEGIHSKLRRLIAREYIRVEKKEDNDQVLYYSRGPAIDRALRGAP